MEDAFYQRGLAAAQEYVSTHPGWRISPQNPFPQGNSHRVISVEHNGTPVVLKFYANPQSKIGELAALRQFATTGLFPQILDDTPERLIVMTQLPGTTLREQLETDTEQTTPEWEAILHQIGQALAKWKSVPFVKLPVVRQSLQEWLRAHIDASWRIYENEPAYHTPFFQYSLQLQQQHLNAITNRPLFLCSLDLNPGNILAHQGKITGFVDVESARAGTEPLQLGVMLFALGAYAYNPARISRFWQSFITGYSQETGLPLSDAILQETLAMCHFKYWTFINCDGDSNPNRPDWFVLPDPLRVTAVLTACERVIASPI